MAAISFTKNVSMSGVSDDILDEFDDLLDDEIEVEGSIAQDGPETASAIPESHLVRSPIAEVNALMATSVSGGPVVSAQSRVATAEEVEAAFNFDPAAALAESRDHVRILNGWSGLAFRSKSVCHPSRLDFKRQHLHALDPLEVDCQTIFVCTCISAV